MLIYQCSEFIFMGTSRFCNSFLIDNIFIWFQTINSLYRELIDAKMGKLKIWTPQQDQILVAVSSSTISKRWRKVSDQLKRHGFERTDIECRERFVNHLDPNVTKGSWSDTELQILYNKYSQYGNKWFLLQKHLPGRTQTKIKNYFYGNIRYLLKIILKTVTKVKTGFINDVRTDILLDIYEGKNDFEGQCIIDKTIRWLGFKVDKKQAEILIQQNKQLFQNFANKFLLKQDLITQQLVKQEASLSEQSSEKNYERVKSRKGEMMEMRESQGTPLKREEQQSLVKVVCMVNGIPNNRKDELEYLQKMMKIHQKWSLYYQKAAESIHSQLEQQSVVLKQE